MRVLVIEDDPDIREALASILAGVGSEVVTAIHGADGLAKLAADGFDVIVLDMLMPVMDGFEFLRRKEQMERVSVPVVVLTAHAHVPPNLDGVVRVLRKPFELDALMDAIENATAASPMPGH